MSSVQENVAAGVEYAVRNLGENFADRVTQPVKINDSARCVFGQATGVHCVSLDNFENEAEHDAYYPPQGQVRATCAEWDRVLAVRRAEKYVKNVEI